MKKLLAIFCAVLAIAACEVTPGPDQPRTGGSKERSILEFELEGQIGDAEIINDDATTGTIRVELSSVIVKDMSKVEIKVLTVSYGATASVKVGETLDFAAGAAPTISVKSEAGDERLYTVQSSSFSESFVGCYKITGSMFYGGIGVDYGGCELMTPETKGDWCWDTNGYGPKANYDDYFEITLDKVNDDGSTEGTCVLYGGEDGKHWNCIFQGAVNKKNPGYDVDLRHFYRLIPMGQSKWKRDYAKGTITFTKDTTVMPLELYGAGTYQIDKKSSEPQKVYEVTVEDQALVYKVPGDPSWTDFETFTDYTKFVRSPKFFAYMITKVDDIPAASKTPGDEGEINVVDPGDDPQTGDDDPDPIGDLSELLGSYVVRSTWLYGGLYANGFVNINTKPWNWNGYDDTKWVGGESQAWFSNAQHEIGNTLEVGFDLTALASAGAKPMDALPSAYPGTLNYGPGEDGEYWDYLYVDNNNKYGITESIDLSYNFGQLPHGESVFSGNINNLTLIIKNADNDLIYARVLTPGANTFDNHDTSGKTETMTVPEGCIGLAFDCGTFTENDLVWDDSWLYGDLDRFVIHPYVYVMVFEKVQNEQ